MKHLINTNGTGTVNGTFPNKSVLSTAKSVLSTGTVNGTNDGTFKHDKYKTVQTSVDEVLPEKEPIEIEIINKDVEKIGQSLEGLNKVVSKSKQNVNSKPNGWVIGIIALIATFVILYVFKDEFLSLFNMSSASNVPSWNPDGTNIIRG